jgi:UPF0755 protein
MATLKSTLDTIVRTLLFVVAAAAMLLVCGGVAWYAFSGGKVGRSPAPTTAATPRPAVARTEPAAPRDTSIEGILLGLYLQLRQGDINRPAGVSDELMPFTIAPGETAASISTHLAEAGLITDSDLFNLYMRHLRLDSTLEAGNYLLRANMAMPEVAQNLQHSTADEVVFTVPEGWRMEQLAEHLQANDIADAQEFIAYVRQGVTQEGLTTKFPFLNDRPPGAPTSLEGFLFPDTYRVPKDSDVKTIVNIMLDNFGRRFDQSLRDAAQAQGSSVYDVTSLAAIVEREAVIPAERPVIASVYLNRLAQGKALESDPTVQYALGYQPDTNQWWKTPLPLEDLVGVDSEWSTYLHPGLTPGPICSPGISSIEAVVNPAQTDYIFFYSRGDGSHAFAVTWEEHLKNQEEYQQ